MAFYPARRGPVRSERLKSEKSAYLVPFLEWVHKVEPDLLERGMKSIRKDTKKDRPGADELLAKWRLDWLPNIGWIIPNGHVFWTSYETKLLEQLEQARRKR